MKEQIDSMAKVGAKAEQSAIMPAAGAVTEEPPMYAADDSHLLAQIQKQSEHDLPNMPDGFGDGAALN